MATFEDMETSVVLVIKKREENWVGKGTENLVLQMEKKETA